MIILYALFAVIAIIVFAFTSRIGLKKRLAIAIGVFVMLSLILTLLILITGDKPADNAITIYPNNGKQSP